MSADWPKAPPYPHGSDYEDLYANYYERDPFALPKASQMDLTGLCVADICCGSAPVAKAALELGAKTAFALDAQLEMLPVKAIPGLIPVNAHVADFLSKPSLRDGKQLDAIFCRQAVNYWMLGVEGAGALIAGALAEGGHFVFNTFLDKPSSEPVVRITGTGAERIIETMWLAADGAIHHSQFRSGRAPHATKFDWISEEDFRRILSPYFHIRIERKGSGAMVDCAKKPAAF